jgi:hypothetical protein
MAWRHRSRTAMEQAMTRLISLRDLRNARRAMLNAGNE